MPLDLLSVILSNIRLPKLYHWQPWLAGEAGCQIAGVEKGTGVNVGDSEAGVNLCKSRSIGRGSPLSGR